MNPNTYLISKTMHWNFWLDKRMVRFFFNTFKSYNLKRFDNFKQRYVLILDMLFLELVILKYLVKTTQKYVTYKPTHFQNLIRFFNS